MKKAFIWSFSLALMVALVLTMSLSLVSDLEGSKELYSAAREEYGKEIKGCKHCHVKALPKEDDHELNELGQWLVDQKVEREAEEIEVSWLEDYPDKE